MEDIFAKLYDMTAFSNIIADPSFLVMYAIAFVLLYLGIKKHYEPLLLIPIAFGVLIANFPGGEMGVIQADENGMVMVNGVMKNIWEMPLHEIAHELGLMNFIYYMLIKTGFLPPVIFMGVGGSYGYFYYDQAGSPSVGPDSYCCLFVYGIGSGYYSVGSEVALY